jgi:hypothetical protein
LPNGAIEFFSFFDGRNVMQEQSQEIRQIELPRLVPHPANANVMPAATMDKLRRHIERTGRYEPLVVRPHPARAGDFELINGHHRKEILESLGYTHGACVVWEMSDGEALLLLATVNRLSGEDSPTKRLALIEELSVVMEADGAALALLLPEEEGTLKKVLEREEVLRIGEAPAMGGMMEALTVFVTAEEKKRVVGALRGTDRELGRALVRWMEERG